jgi:hypothetical protein
VRAKCRNTSRIAPTSKVNHAETGVNAASSMERRASRTSAKTYAENSRFWNVQREACSVVSGSATCFTVGAWCAEILWEAVIDAAAFRSASFLRLKSRMMRAT